MANQLRTLYDLVETYGVDPLWLTEQADNGTIPCVRLPDGKGGDVLLFHLDDTANCIARMARQPSPKRSAVRDA